ncbi:MAG TPA: TetR/AcrR family transcriptional regulator [Longimicrobium sp.]|nr:TetR/AcrR family transcriptional regulator [Longimicrobium sp.]
METRDRILDAAREMFATRGIEATTMRAIAERIEYTPTAIYHHFKDKDALILELCHADFRALGRQFTRMERIDDPVERLRRIGLAYVDFAIAFPNHYRIMFMTSIPPHEHEDKNPEEDAYGFLVKTVEDGIAQGRFRPEFSDPEELAQIMWSGVHGIVSLHLAKCDSPWIDFRPLRPTSEKLVDVMVRGLLRDPQG